VTVTDTAGFGDTKGWNGSIGRRMFEDQEWEEDISERVRPERRQADVCTLFLIVLRQLKSKTIDWTMKEKKLLSWGGILVSLRSWRLQDSKDARH
jgi:hypothetical protein